MNNLASLLNKALKEDPLAIEYFALKDKILNDAELMSFLNEIKECQNKANNYLKNNDIKSYKEEKENLKKLKEIFLNHPLINNYLVCKNELRNKIEQIAMIISVD